MIYSQREVHEVAEGICTATATGRIPVIEVTGWHATEPSESPMLDVQIDLVDCSLGESPKHNGITVFDDHGEPLTTNELLAMTRSRTREITDPEALRQALRRLYEAFLTSLKAEAPAACDRSVATLRNEIQAFRPVSHLR